MHNAHSAVDAKTVKYLYCKLTKIEYCPAGYILQKHLSMGRIDITKAPEYGYG
jgi:hypothetical protein